MPTIKLEWPDSRLMPNRKHGKHWSATHAAKNYAKEYAYFDAKQAIGDWKAPDDGKVAISVVFCPPDRRRRDLDNLFASMKPQFDSIAKALGIDDSRFCPVLLDVGPIGKPGCVVVAVGVKIVTSIEID